MNKKRFLVLGLLVIIVIVFTIVLFFARTRSNPEMTPTLAGQPSTTTSSTVASITPVVISYEYHVGLPNALMLVDSQGRRTGKNPLTGLFYREIPGTSYGEIGSATSSPQGAGELFFTQPVGCPYAVYVVGGQTGAYWFDASVYQPFRQQQKISGNIQLGSMVEYVPNYNEINPASSTLSFEATISSTASITSAPPHNLPPPPVP